MGTFCRPSFNMAQLCSRVLNVASKSNNLGVWKRCYSSGTPTTKLLINGEFVDSKTDNWIPVTNPATNEVVSYCPETTPEELRSAADAAQEAFKTWKDTSILKRQEVMLKYQQKIKDNMGNLAKVITVENGKTLSDAEGSILRGLQVVEH